MKKRGRPYKNPHLVPEGLANHIRELKQQRDELLAALKHIAAESGITLDYDLITEDAEAAIAKAEGRAQ